MDYVCFDCDFSDGIYEWDLFIYVKVFEYFYCVFIYVYIFFLYKVGYYYVSFLLFVIGCFLWGLEIVIF